MDEATLCYLFTRIAYLFRKNFSLHKQLSSHTGMFPIFMEETAFLNTKKKPHAITTQRTQLLESN